MIYPKKKRKAGFGLDLSQLKIKEGFQENPEMAADLGSGAEGFIKKAGTRDLGYGVKHTGAGANIAGSSIGGMGKGYNIGSKFGAKGAIIGAGIGATIGLGKGIIESIGAKKNAFNERDSRELTAITDEKNDGAAMYNQMESKQLYAEDGTKLPDSVDQPTDDKAVILGGKRHKDGGNDVVDQNGEKVAETEREEIIFSKSQTEMIEASIAKIEGGDESEYLNLGSYVKEIINTRTKDNSGKFKKLEDADISKR